jgi:hypothetical protein
MCHPKAHQAVSSPALQKSPRLSAIFLAFRTIQCILERKVLLSVERQWGGNRCTHEQFRCLHLLSFSLLRLDKVPLR